MSAQQAVTRTLGVSVPGRALTASVGLVSHSVGCIDRLWPQTAAVERG